MSNRPLRTLQDVVRAKLCLEITCGGCGRVAVYQAVGFVALVGNASAVTLGRLEQRLRCADSFDVQGCGHRGAVVRAIKWPPSSEAKRPEPVAEHVPVGISPEAWGRADARERRRLIRLARG